VRVVWGRLMVPHELANLNCHRCSQLLQVVNPLRRIGIVNAFAVKSQRQVPLADHYEPTCGYHVRKDVRVQRWS
jgi:hypothetical protein